MQVLVWGGQWSTANAAAVTGRNRRSDTRAASKHVIGGAKVGHRGHGWVSGRVGRDRDAHFCQICAVSSQSIRQLTTYWPGAIVFGMTTLSLTMPSVQSPEHHPSCWLLSGRNGNAVGMWVWFVPGPYQPMSSSGQGDGNCWQSIFSLHHAAPGCLQAAVHLPTIAMPTLSEWILHPWNRVPGPGRANGDHGADRVVDKLARDGEERAVVPHQGVAVTDKVERHLLELLLGTRHLLERAKAVLIPAAVVEPPSGGRRPVAAPTQKQNKQQQRIPASEEFRRVEPWTY